MPLTQKHQGWGPPSLPWEKVPVPDGFGEEGEASILASGGQQGELFVMGALLEGGQFGFQRGAMCKATLDFVEHQQSISLVLVLQSRPAQHLQHVVDTRGVPKLVEDKACCSPLDHFYLGYCVWYVLA